MRSSLVLSSLLVLALTACGGSSGGPSGGGPGDPTDGFDRDGDSEPDPGSGDPDFDGRTVDPLRPDPSEDPDAQEEPDAPEKPDGPAAPPAPKPPAAPPSSPPPSASKWLKTQGNRILRADGSVWQGRGANLHDTGGCDACTGQEPSVDEVKRRIDELVDVWGADFIRFVIESPGGQDVLSDPDHLDRIEEVMDHVGTKRGVYVLLSIWHDGSTTELGWPTDRTRQIWRVLAERFADDAHVLYGLVNEPSYNFDGAQDAQVWGEMNSTVAAIREVEADLGTPSHIILVQGTGGWARRLDYYLDHPITAGGGKNIAYEVHVYDPASAFDERFIEPARTLPVVIGEFGPMEGAMNLPDSITLMQKADELRVPWLAWTFHMRCPPNLLEDHSQGGCGVDMPLVPTEWGEAVIERLAR